MKVGKIDFSLNNKEYNFSDLDRIVRDSGYDLIYIFSDINQNIEINRKKGKYNYIDTQAYLTMKIPLKIRTSEYILITENNLFQYLGKEELYKIVDQVALISRFNYEPRIKFKKIRELYYEFVNNSLNGSYGDGIIVEIDISKRVKGLILLGSRGGIGREILIGVDNKYRGEGIGERLFQKSLSYWKERDIKEIRTVVSLQNISSLSFHLKLGYKVNKFKNIYHLWLKS